MMNYQFEDALTWPHMSPFCFMCIDTEDMLFLLIYLLPSTDLYPHTEHVVLQRRAKMFMYCQALAMFPQKMSLNSSST